MSFSISIDIGGTFTDCVVKRGPGDTHIFKAPSTPDAYEQGFMERPLEAFLAETDPIVHGSTISTNALVEGKTGRTGLIVTKGIPTSSCCAKVRASSRSTGRSTTRSRLSKDRASSRRTTTIPLGRAIMSAIEGATGELSAEPEINVGTTIERYAG